MHRLILMVLLARSDELVSGPPNNSLERTGDSAAEARDSQDARPRKASEGATPAAQLAAVRPTPTTEAKLSKKKPRVSKEEAEKAIFRRFVDAYEGLYSAELTGVIHRDSPDFSAVDSITAQTLGIEVTGAYQDEREAEINYWLEGEWGTIVGNAAGLIANINTALIDKAERAKSYEKIGPLLLAIYIGSFIFHHETDMRFIVPSLSIPFNHYSLICLVITDERGDLPKIQVLQEMPGWREGG